MDLIRLDPRAWTLEHNPRHSRQKNADLATGTSRGSPRKPVAVELDTDSLLSLRALR